MTFFTIVSFSWYHRQPGLEVAFILPSKRIMSDPQELPSVEASVETLTVEDEVQLVLNNVLFGRMASSDTAGFWAIALTLIYLHICH